LPKIISHIGDMFTHGVVPWGAYEAAERYGPKGSGLPAALAAAVGGGLLRTARSPEAVARRNTLGTTDAQWDASQAMYENAKSRGIDLSGAEAIAQTKNQPNAPILRSLRLAETHASGSPVTSAFFEPRAAQVDVALDSALNDIAQRPVNPQNIGPKVSQSAQKVLNDAKERINAQTKSDYKAAELDQIDPQEYATLAADPAYASSLKRLRADDILGKTLHNYPDNSIEVIDAVTKDLFSRGEAATVQGEGFNPHKGQIQTDAAQAARDAATKSNQNYAQALAEQHEFRQGELTDLESGPVGDFSKAKTTPGVAERLFPETPTSATTSALGDAITRIRGMGQEMLPAVREAFDRIRSSVSTGTLGGDRSRVGAKFAQELAGSPEKEELLKTVLSAAGAPGRGIQSLGDLIPILQATGKRLTEGSPTAPMNAQLADLGRHPVTDVGTSIATGSLAPLFTGSLTDWLTHRNVRGLAEYVTGAPADMRVAAARAYQNVVPEALSRAGLGSLLAINREK
jgi:hypothetical protein